MTKVGFCLVPKEAAIFDSLVANFWRNDEKRLVKFVDGDSQQTLNCALSPQAESWDVKRGLSIFFEIKDLDRNSRKRIEKSIRDRLNESQISNFRFPSRGPSRF